FSLHCRSFVSVALNVCDARGASGANVPEARTRRLAPLEGCFEAARRRLDARSLTPSTCEGVTRCVTSPSPESRGGVGKSLRRRVAVFAHRVDIAQRPRRAARPDQAP